MGLIGTGFKELRLVEFDDIELSTQKRKDSCMTSIRESITLRPLMATDVDAFMSWGGDPDVTKSLFWDHYQRIEDAQDFLKKVAESHPWYMAICINNVPVGGITLDVGKGRAHCRAELGYVIAKAHWGQGVATAAVMLALTKGPAELGVSRIDAFVDPENHGSIKVLKKAGMIEEALLKKYVVHRGQIRDRLLFCKIF